MGKYISRAPTSNPTPTPTSELRNEICFNIITFTQRSARGGGVSWTVGNCSSSQTYDTHHVYHEECCLESGDYTVTCFDSNGYGWENYDVMFINDDARYCAGFDDGYSYVDPKHLTVSEQSSPSFEHCYNISIRTGTNAEQILWLLFHDSGFCSSDQTYSDNSTYTVECCHDELGTTLWCLDAGVDGWHGATLTINGTQYCSDFQSTAVMGKYISRAPTSNPTPTPTQIPTSYPSEAPTTNLTPIPTPTPTHTPSLNPSDVPTYNPTLIPTFHPSEAPTCVEVEHNWNEEIAEQRCSADETGKTMKGVDAIVCSGYRQYYQRRLNYSLANQAYTHCSAWCVYDTHTDGYGDPSEHDDAFIWRNPINCWEPVRKGLCIDGNTHDRDSMAVYIEKTLCTSCLPLYTWSEDRAEEICPDIIYAKKDYGVKVCDDPNSSTKQASLDKSLANRFFTHCKAWCVYDYDTIMNNRNPSLGGFVWKKSCWKWVTGYDCFTKHSNEFSAVSLRAANLCE